MSLATGSILIPKLILIATTLIFAPYILPITMVAELLIIVLLNWCLFGNISKIIWYISNKIFITIQFSLGFDSSTLLTLISPAFFKPPKNAEIGNEETDYLFKNIQSLIFWSMMIIHHYDDDDSRFFITIQTLFWSSITRRSYFIIIIILINNHNVQTIRL